VCACVCVSVCVCVCVCVRARVYARLSVGTGLKHGIPLTKAAMLLTSPQIFQCAEKRFSRRVGKLLAQTLLIHGMTLSKAPVLK
jgi:hypothetical protein